MDPKSIDGENRLRSSPRSSGESLEDLTANGVSQSDPPSLDWNRLHARGIRLWRIENLLVSGSVLAGALIGGSALWLSSDKVPGWVLAPIWGVLIGLVLWSTCWLPPRTYDAWSYGLDDRVLVLRFGIFWQTSVMIPLSRLQHLDVQQGPLERRFGLATLIVHTAGTENASHEIPHLEHRTALQLREHLIEMAGIEVQ